MQVVPLQAEIDDAKPEPPERIVQRLLDHPEAALAAQVPHFSADANGRVNDRRLFEARPRLVGDERPRLFRLPARAIAPAAPCAGERRGRGEFA
jgi:hypothetical protein